ncbi:M23 family metallopeptidase [Aurantiacibacter sediminis]|uniref:M23 family metallopeptidase n=1 Tax=Aurantiacibacter sediminis TaxID=2793064 RepID=A0ABS0MZY8_9SPHN|nr:M23 family metallopeptidase [Aurantiacibacter sediminis]MBH5321275.1 M23 family metallopeptidase [Aurantiacibacter sediminis]
MIFKFAKAIAAGSLLIATPALAEDEPRTGLIDADRVTEGGMDEEFSELFASWEESDSDIAADRAEMAADYAPAASGSFEVVQSVTVSTPWLMPIEGARLTSGYGNRNHPVLRRRAHHHGVDLAAPTGTPVYATADGTVEMAQWYSSYGNYVQIDHGGDVETRYAHLSRYTVRDGERVSAGDLIGYVGSTGRSTGPHLHYEIRMDGQSVNPIPYMTAQLDTDNSEQAARGGD